MATQSLAPKPSDPGWECTGLAMIRYIALGCLLVLTSCSQASAPKTSVYEATGSSAQRVAAVTAILSKRIAPPTTILDAYFIEERIGEGGLGPSDYRTFCVVELAPQDVDQWTRLLTPLTQAAAYAAPTQPRDWWVSREAHAALAFYQPATLTGRAHGWIGVSAQTGRIYIFTFTT